LPLGPSKGRNASGPLRIAMCAAAEAARYAAERRAPSAGLVQERPKPPWRRGDLLDWVGFRGGVAYNGEGAVDRLALRSLDCWTYLLPLASPRQVCHPALEAAVEQQPPVLVCQGQGLHPVHDGAGVVGASSCTGRFQGCSANPGANSEKAGGSVVHAQRGGDRCGGGRVLGVNCALVRLSTETEGCGEGCQDLESPHGGLPGALEESFVRECDRASQAHLRHLLLGPLQGQHKKQWP
jgi:hypothetical protein